MKKLTKIQKQNKAEYTKQLKRVKQFISRAEKRGYHFPDVLPTPPTGNPTKRDINKLKKLRPDTLYGQALYANPETGEAITGLEARKLERKISANKAVKSRNKTTQNSRTSDTVNTHEYIPDETENVIAYIRERIRSWSPDSSMSRYMAEAKKRHISALEHLLDNAILELGKKQVARNLQGSAQRVSEIVDTILLASNQDEVYVALNEIAEIIKGSKLDFNEARDIEMQMDGFNLNYEDVESDY